MAFVNERISEEQKAKLDLKTLHVPWSIDVPFRGIRWAIDRDRDVFLLSLAESNGRDGESPERLALSWKGEVIKFEALYEETGRYPAGNLEGWWKVKKFSLPAHLESRRSEVVELIREALIAFGSHMGSTKYMSKINVSFQI